MIDNPLEVCGIIMVASAISYMVGFAVGAFKGNSSESESFAWSVAWLYFVLPCSLAIGLILMIRIGAIPNV